MFGPPIGIRILLTKAKRHSIDSAEMLNIRIIMSEVVGLRKV